MPPLTRIAVWNAEFHKPSTTAGASIREIMASRNADVICLTEGYPGKR